MPWWFDWPQLLLLLVVVNAGAELLLLKHGENLYCVSDDPDTPALAWNHDLNAAYPPAVEEVYWSPSPPTTYSGLNCKPQLAKQQKCGDWDIKNWNTVKSYEKDLPPVLDFRWNDLQHEVVLKDNAFSVIQLSARKLYLTVSLLVSDSAAIELENSVNIWRVVIDGWINHPNPRRELQWWFRNVKTVMECDSCGGLILNRGARWTTVTLKYEARQGGDVIKLHNHETGDENTWITNQDLNGVTDVYFSISKYATASLGHWRLHSYDILEPTSTGPMTFSFTAADTARLCVSLTYISPLSKDQNTVAWLRFYVGNKYLDKEIRSTGNEWRTVKYVFDVEREVKYYLAILPVNFQDFAVGEVRACSEQELRVSKIANSAARECSDLKRNTSVALKRPDKSISEPHGVDPEFPRSNPQVQCITNVIPNVRDCRGVLICSSSACSCAPGYHGDNCELVCNAGTFGQGCKNKCNTNCSHSCDPVTGECNFLCQDGLYGTHCEYNCSQGYYGRLCGNACSENCVNSCDPKTGACDGGCKPGYQGEHCSNKCGHGKYGHACQEICSPNCINGCNPVTGHCVDSCKEGFQGLKCNECTANRFGDNCEVCGKCYRNALCDKKTGQCPGSSCEPGYYGIGCWWSCGDGWYGSGCLTSCGECKNPPCDKVTGTCRGGCRSGYVGYKCHSTCTYGRYGESCQQRCSNNCKGTRTCDIVTGKCVDGCKNGYKNDDCKTPCDHGTYGEDCKKICGRCKNKAPCHTITGRCQQECETNFAGEKCDGININ